MLFGEHVAMHSGHLAFRAALCYLGGFTVVGEAGTVSSPPSQGQGWEGWQGHSMGPTPGSHLWLWEVVA